MNVMVIVRPSSDTARAFAARVAVVRIAAVSLGALLATAIPAHAQLGPQSPESGLIAANMDRATPASADYYRHANGEWLAKVPIPSDRSRWGVDRVMAEENTAKLRALLEEAAGARPDGDAALLVDPHHGGGHRGALRVADHADALAVEHGGGGVGGPEVDPDVERTVCHAGSLATIRA